jgi:hypothetical protein
MLAYLPPLTFHLGVFLFVCPFVVVVSIVLRDDMAIAWRPFLSQRFDGRSVFRRLLARAGRIFSLLSVLVPRNPVNSPSDPMVLFEDTSFSEGPISKTIKVLFSNCT